MKIYKEIYRDCPNLVQAFASTSPYSRGLRSPLEEEISGLDPFVELPTIEEFEELSSEIGNSAVLL